MHFKFTFWPKRYCLTSEVKGQRSIQQKDADMIYKVDRRSLILISKSILELQVFEVFNLASEVKFDLGGQRSFLEKVVHLIQEINRKNFI